MGGLLENIKQEFILLNLQTLALVVKNLVNRTDDYFRLYSTEFGYISVLLQMKETLFLHRTIYLHVPFQNL